MCVQMAYDTKAYQEGIGFKVLTPSILVSFHSIEPAHADARYFLFQKWKGWKCSY